MIFSNCKDGSLFIHFIFIVSISFNINEKLKSEYNLNYYQEEEIERCKACKLVFHKHCFRKLANCPCGAQLRLNETRSFTNRASQRGETRGALDLLGRGLTSGFSQRFLSGLFTSEKPEKTRDHKDENIILMGSLPTTSL